MARADLVIGKGLLPKQSNFLLVATSGRTFVQTVLAEITSQPRRLKISSRVIEIPIAVVRRRVRIVEPIAVGV